MPTVPVNESTLENIALSWFAELGYEARRGDEIAPGEPAAERDAFDQVILLGRLRDAVDQLNLQIPAEAREEALRKVLHPESPSLVANNRKFHAMLRDGVEVEYRRRDGSIAGDRVRLIIDGDDVAPSTKLELEVLVKGLFEKRRHLEFLRNFVAFEEDPHSDALIKILAGYHQFHAVQQAVDASIKATGPTGDRRCGVVWHTQGSGKSLSIEKTDANTRAVFGDYISIYDIQRAVEDQATVQIYYESRIAKLALKDEQLPKLDPEFEEITEGEEQERKEKLKTKWAALEVLVGDQRRLQPIAADLVEHFERRLEAMDGKAMVVCQAVSQLSQAFALCAAHDEAKRIRDDVSFFQHVRAALVKSGPSGKSDDELDQAIRQLVSKAIAAPNEVVDIFTAAGLKKPDISSLSDEFLAEVKFGRWRCCGIIARTKSTTCLPPPLMTPPRTRRAASTRREPWHRQSGWPRYSGHDQEIRHHGHDTADARTCPLRRNSQKLGRIVPECGGVGSWPSIST